MSKRDYESIDCHTDGKMHDIPAGTRTRHERAIVDGTWGSFYVCLACMDKWLKEFSR
jgi:hypothetical protein